MRLLPHRTSSCGGFKARLRRPLIYRRTIYIEHNTHTAEEGVRSITKQSQSNVAGDPLKGRVLCDSTIICCRHARDRSVTTLGAGIDDGHAQLDARQA